MPTNKHASFRYRALDQCFTHRGHRKWTLNELVEEVSRLLREAFGAGTTLSKRTIQGDINVMRSPRPRGFGAPIVCRQGLYFYNVVALPAMAGMQFVECQKLRVLLNTLPRIGPSRTGHVM